MIEVDPWNPQDIQDRFELLLRRSLASGPSPNWYGIARRWIRSVARNHSLPFEALAQAVAVMSPQVSWDSQRKFLPVFLLDLASGGDGSAMTHPGFTVNRRKAARILRTANPVKRDALVTGPKVSAFAEALMGQFSGRVVIDTHMMDAGLGIRNPEDRPIYGNLTEKRFDLLSQALIRARNIVDPKMSPHQAQALVWTEQRRLRGLI